METYHRGGTAVWEWRRKFAWLIYALVVKKLDPVVGHVPHSILILCHFFLSRGRSITCTVTGIRKYSDDLPQGGLEVPC